MGNYKNVYKNSEGYFDPTAGEAISKMLRENRLAALNQQKQFRPLVYICSRYSGDTKENVHAARRYCRFAVKQGYIPIAPHLLFTQFLNDSDEKERELGIKFGKVMMDKCREVWVFGSEFSSGMQEEIDRAVRKNYKIRYFNEEYREVFRVHKTRSDNCDG